jgi:hypothetical protein
VSRSKLGERVQYSSYLSYFSTPKMKMVHSSKKAVIYQTTWRHNPQHINLWEIQFLKRFNKLQLEFITSSCTRPRTSWAPDTDIPNVLPATWWKPYQLKRRQSVSELDFTSSTCWLLAVAFPLTGLSHNGSYHNTCTRNGGQCWLSK